MSLRAVRVHGILFMIVASLGLGAASALDQSKALARILECPGSSGWTMLRGLSRPLAELEPQARRSASPYVLAQSYVSSSTIYLGVSSGLLLSDDCGSTWVPVTGGVSPPRRAVPSLATDPAGRLYVGFGTNLAGPDAVSEDGGQTWRTSPVLTNHLAASPSSPGTVYGFANVRANTGFTKLGRTTDGGLTWQVWDARRIDAPPGVSPYVWESKLVVDPRDSDTVYCPMFGTVLRSVDGGRTFSSFIKVGSGVSALALSIDGARWWIAAPNDSLYTTTDGGASWLPVSLPEPINIEQLVASPHDPRVVFAVTDRGAYAYRLPTEEEVPDR